MDSCFSVSKFLICGVPQRSILPYYSSGFNYLLKTFWRGHEMSLSPPPSTDRWQFAAYFCFSRISSECHSDYKEISIWIKNRWLKPNPFKTKTLLVRSGKHSEELGGMLTSTPIKGSPSFLHSGMKPWCPAGFITEVGSPGRTTGKKMPSCTFNFQELLLRKLWCALIQAYDTMLDYSKSLYFELQM